MRKLLIGLYILVMMTGIVMVSDPGRAEEGTQFFGILIYRTGPYAPGGSGFGSGWEDFMQLRNMGGGVNGITYSWEECETAYNTARGVECYERMKDRMIYAAPLSTGITYALISRATKQKIVFHTMGYGRADASDGRVFPYVFTTPTNYWSQNSAKIKFIGSRLGGMDKLRGQKIANLYIDIPYGQETRPLLDALSKQYGFTIRHFPVAPPAIDQKAQWLDIVRRYKADWVISRNWGVSCTVPLREASRLGFPRDHIIGVWWCGSEEDVRPAGPAAKDYITGNFHGVGRDFPIIQEIIDKVYGARKGNISLSRVGSVYYNRGVVNGIIVEEAMRTAHRKFGVKVLTGEELRWGFENLNLTEKRLKEIGVEGLVPPMKNSCLDHEGGGPVRFQQWDGQKWVALGTWVSPMKDFVRQRVEISAAAYAKEKGIVPVSCE